MGKLLVPFSILGVVLLSLPFIIANEIDDKVLNVGEELYKETLPLRMGTRLYQLQGMKPYTRYEVKISYPASIPAVFSLQLKRGNSDVGLNRLRKLLNTEKIIFKTGNLEEMNHQGGMYVLVTVEPEGVVAIRGVRERETILFNIVCDELLLGIPHKAWLVVILAVLCIALAFTVPRFLPPYLLPRNRNPSSAGRNANKSS